MSNAAAPKTETETETVKQPPRILRAMRSLNDRRMGAMFLLSFAAGLPYGATAGLLNAWLTEVGITPATIGVLALVTLGYSFKYLWAPLFQIPRTFPGLGKLGPRRSWLFALQIIMTGLLCIYATVDPVENITLIAGVALVVSLVSPTHDLILDAWRIEVARSDEDKDLMSALYQFGYKSAGFITGFIALLIADYLSWEFVFIMVAGFMLLSIGGTLLAPEPANSRLFSKTRASFYSSLPIGLIRPAVLAMAASWLVAFFLIARFVVQALGEGASGRVFVQQQGPLIVCLTVIVPAIISAVLVFVYNGKVIETNITDNPAKRADRIFATLFRAIYDPFMDLMIRLRWGVILVLLLALTYRFTDAVWGSFAYPFYLGENFGAIGHSLSDVAIASKFFGVIATILGSLLGAILIAAFGRMPVFFIGGVVAAATNLLYADLATGATVLDAILAFTHLDVPLVAFADWAAKIQPADIIIAPDQGQRMARLMITIFAENLAGGLALVAITAYLTSVVNPRFAAVQYALLASLTMLIGTLGRPWLGEMIEVRGFYYVFMVTFWLGGVAVVLSLLEWWRQSRNPVAQNSMILDQD